MFSSWHLAWITGQTSFCGDTSSAGSTSGEKLTGSQLQAGPLPVVVEVENGHGIGTV